MDRFWSKVRKGDGCWEWVGYVAPNGYGRFRFQGKAAKAHRVSWVLTHGPIPERQHVLHSCDNPRCVRPDHLHLGTHGDNMREMFGRGRRRFNREVNNAWKLTPDQADEIRAKYAAGDTSHQKLAREYGISKPYVGAIVNRRAMVFP